MFLCFALGCGPSDEEIRQMAERYRVADEALEREGQEAQTRSDAVFSSLDSDIVALRGRLAPVRAAWPDPARLASDRCEPPTGAALVIDWESLERVAAAPTAPLDLSGVSVIGTRSLLEIARYQTPIGRHEATAQAVRLIVDRMTAAQSVVVVKATQVVAARVVPAENGRTETFTPGSFVGHAVVFDVQAARVRCVVPIAATSSPSVQTGSRHDLALADDLALRTGDEVRTALARVAPGLTLVE
ncbi:MAG: hypothetical protein SFX73_04250 [Kofleriaceae bacterium]|nr:hypothetical protein [Kofleriaceae bacterium]